VRRSWWLLAAVVVAMSPAATPGATPGAAVAAGGTVLVAPLDAGIDPVSARFVEQAVDEAERIDAAALVIELDTPGGLSTSMDDIVQELLGAQVPVIVYVSPDGARAASAGVFITMAADLAAMAPNTSIGAATPVSAGGGDIEGDLRRKVVNDAASRVRALAETHGRNADMAERTVRGAESFTASEAVGGGLVERLAPSLDELLADVDGARTPYKDAVLQTGGATVERFEMPLTLRLLAILINPNLLFILFLAGLAGIAYEIIHPGAIVPGTAGAICLVLALFGFSTVPIDWAGIALIALGVGLVILEAFITSGGLLGASGAVSLAVGGLLLFPTEGGDGVSPWVAGGVAVAVGGGLAAVATSVVAARRAPPSPFGAGADGMLGLRGVARTPLQPRGQVFVHGELWEAETAGEPLAAGTPVIVRDVNGLTLAVGPDDREEAQASPR
jgi:membrane-bound serine protease (ClpP class)